MDSQILSSLAYETVLGYALPAVMTSIALSTKGTLHKLYLQIPPQTYEVAPKDRNSTMMFLQALVHGGSELDAMMDHLGELEFSIPLPISFAAGSDEKGGRKLSVIGQDDG